MPRPPNPELPNLLMDAALALLDEREDVRFSMRELAGRINYSVTAVYRCYERRGDMLRKLTVKLFGLMAAEVIQPGPGSPAEVVGDLGERFVAWCTRYPGRFRLMFLYAEPEARLDAEEQMVARAGLRYLELVLKDASEKGEIDVEDPGALATVLMGSLVGLTSLILAGRIEGVAPDQAAAYYRAHRDAWLRPLLSAS